MQIVSNDWTMFLRISKIHTEYKEKGTQPGLEYEYQIRVMIGNAVWISRAPL